MVSVLRGFWPLCQLQAGPQDLPASPALLRHAMLLCLVSGVLVFSITLPILDALLRAATAIAMSLLLWSALLQLARREQRRLQTLTAVFGCAALLNFALWPLLLLATALGEKPGLLPLLALALALWSLVVNGHILRHALDWPLPRALAVAVLLFALRYSLFHFIFS